MGQVKPTEQAHMTGQDHRTGPQNRLGQVRPGRIAGSAGYIRGNISLQGIAELSRTSHGEELGRLALGLRQTLRGWAEALA